MTSTQTDTLPHGTRIGQTALVVASSEEMTEFYRRVVGLSVLDQSATTSVLGVDETPLLVLQERTDAFERPESATGLFHVAFRVPSREALGDALGRIRDHWQLDGASDHRVSEALYLTDPEGNGVEIYRDFPEDEWPIGDDGNIQLDNDPLDIEGVEAAAGGEAQALTEMDIGHLHLEVSSLDAFRDFYVETLGFEVKTDLPNAYFVSDGEYHHQIAANTWNNRTKPRSGRGVAWFEVVLPETEGFEALRGRLADSRWSLTETDDSLSVAGPDEIEIRLRVET